MQDSLQEDNHRVQEGMHQEDIQQADSLQLVGNLVVGNLVAGTLLERVGNDVLLLGNHEILSLAHHDACLYHLPLSLLNFSKIKPTKEFDTSSGSKIKHT